MSLKENIKYLRKQAGLTQSELAEKIGVKRPVIGAYEEGRAEPRIPTLRLLAGFFEVSIDALLDRDLSTGESHADVTGRSLRILPIVMDPDEGRERTTLVPVKAAAGYLTGFGDVDYIGGLPRFALPFPELPPERTYRVFQIEGESMLPVPPGSYVVCEYVQDWNSLKTDERYVFLTRDEGIVFKRVRIHPESRSYELISDNPEYKPYLIKQSQVLEVWKARGMMNFDLEAFAGYSRGSMKEVLTAIERVERLVQNGNRPSAKK